MRWLSLLSTSNPLPIFQDSCLSNGGASICLVSSYSLVFPQPYYDLAGQPYVLVDLPKMFFELPIMPKCFACHTYLYERHNIRIKCGLRKRRNPVIATGFLTGLVSNGNKKLLFDLVTAKPSRINGYCVPANNIYSACVFSE
jgi:hypothetical protein